MHAGHNINRRLIQHALRAHHGIQSTSSQAHPQSTFHIPNGPGEHHFLASAMLSNLLDNAI